jgi:hypothetical protein
MNIEHSQSRYDPAVEDLAKEAHLEVNKVEQLYETELVNLEAGANVTGFLPIFALRNVRETLCKRILLKMPLASKRASTSRSILWKYPIAWFVMLMVAVANGALRDLTYGRWMDELSANQISCMTGMVLLGVVIWAFVRLYPLSSSREAVLAGLFWMGLTVAFEFLFFHFIGAHSWAELAANYNVLQGRLWVFVLAWVAIAPYLFFRLTAPLSNVNATR